MDKNICKQCVFFVNNNCIGLINDKCPYTVL